MKRQLPQIHEDGAGKRTVRFANAGVSFCLPGGGHSPAYLPEGVVRIHSHDEHDTYLWSHDDCMVYGQAVGAEVVFLEDTNG